MSNTHKHKTDLELIAEFKQTANNELLAPLFERYAHLVLGVCVKYLKDEDDAQDALMQIFKKLIADLKKHSIDNFKAWLHTVAKNYCLMQLRTNKNIQQKQIELYKNEHTFMEMQTLDHPSTAESKEMALQEMEEALKQLNAEQKMCVELFYLQELSYQQIANKTGYSVNNVKSFIQNGKRNMKLIMTKQK